MSTKSNNSLLRIDALLRQATASIWNSLPAGKRNTDDLQGEALRLLMRVIQNFSDDLEAFAGEPVPGNAEQSAAYARVGEPAVSQSKTRYPNSGKPWSAQADEELRQLFESGNSINDLSLYFQRTANGIRARLVKLNLLDPNEFRPRFAA